MVNLFVPTDQYRYLCKLTVLAFNDTSTLVGHFVSSLREREKREEIVEKMKEMDKGKRGK